MSGDLRSSSQATFARRSRPACRAPRAAPRRGSAALLAGALVAALAPAACGGADAAEDAPAPPSTGIPLAAPGARGAPLEAAPPAPSIPSSPFGDPEGLQIPPDTFGVPGMPPTPAPSGNAEPGGSGVEL
ncbi:hypothetical protein WMF04_21185 [Sorangium sp. So ce260]|uniref:hypothetical protein n=1 Tax=Sorangium sp. So ce260 TaxID=3133291 RepID=UPI003F60ED99